MLNMPTGYLTAVIIDDEPPLCALLQRLLTDAWPELQIVGIAHNGTDGRELILSHQPDIAFLDIRMPGENGLELARQVDGLCHLVFVTAYDQYAVEAFENAALDYLLKPVSLERLQKTAGRIKSRLQQQPANLLPLLEQLTAHASRTRSHLQWLQVAAGQDIELVPVEEVDYFQSSDKYTLVITARGERLIRTSLKELEAELDPERFWRIHRNAIVRVAAIARVSRDFSGRPLLHLHRHESTLSVGRSYAHLFRQR